MAPMDIAPILYSKSHFKKRMVARELLNESWDASSEAYIIHGGIA
jgi:hypothetical protein